MEGGKRGEEEEEDEEEEEEEEGRECKTGDVEGVRGDAGCMPHDTSGEKKITDREKRQDVFV